jgi:hypothetical protein
MTDQHGENPIEPTDPGSGQPESAATPPPADAPAPPPAAPAAPAASSGPQFDLADAKALLQGAHRFDLGIIAAGVIAFLAGFMPFYTASASFAGHSVSGSWSAWHGFFGWFGVLVALAGAVLVTLPLFKVSVPVSLYQAAVAVFGLALVCLVLSLFVTPSGADCGGASAFGIDCNSGHGFGYWLALLAVLAGGALSFMRMRESTAGSATA